MSHVVCGPGPSPPVGDSFRSRGQWARQYAEGERNFVLRGWQLTWEQQWREDDEETAGECEERDGNQQRPPPSEIKRQVYFSGMDWSALLRRELEPPMVPNVTDPLDTQNFDDYELDTKYLGGGPYDNNPSNWDFGF